MNIPIRVAQIIWKIQQRLAPLKERLSPLRERFAPQLKTFAIIGAAMPVAPLFALLAMTKHNAPHAVSMPASATLHAAAPTKPATVLVMASAEDRVLVLHDYAAPADPIIVLRPRPHLNVDGVVSACGGEIGLLCNGLKDDPWGSVRCLRRNADNLRPMCLKSLRPSQEVASND